MDEETSDRPARPPQPRIEGWKKTLLVISIVMMALGAGLTAYGRLKASERKSQAPAPSAPASTAAESSTSVVPPTGSRGFVDNRSRPAPTGTIGSTGTSSTPPTPAESAAEMPSRIETFSPALFKLGFSFFAGFCIAYALRTILKIALTIIGIAFLAGFALQYFNVLDINWHLLGGHYDSAAQWLSTQFSSFKTFITGQLPSAASATAGLAIGLKR